MTYSCVDVYDSKASGCEMFDGRTLSYGSQSHDLVVFGFVLHHAADHTISLLQHAARVASRYIVILEDLKGRTKYETGNQFNHEPLGTFRGAREWLAMFELLQLTVVRTVEVPPNCSNAAGKKPHTIYPRGLFILENRAKATPPEPTRAPLVAQHESTIQRDKAAVVLFANRRYEPCTRNLLRTLRDPGDFRGSVVAALDYEPGGELKTEFDRLEVTSILLADACQLSMRQLSQLKGHSPGRWMKISIFTCAWFRKFDRLVLMDVDQTIKQPFVAHFFEALEAQPEWLLLLDNGPGVGKADFFTMEFKNSTPPGAMRSEIFNFKNTGQTSLMFVQVHALPPPDVLEAQLLRYQEMIGRVQRHDDQSLILSFFQQHLATFASCLPVKIARPNQTLPAMWHKHRHCQCRVATPHLHTYDPRYRLDCGVQPFFEHDYKKECVKPPKPEPRSPVAIRVGSR